VEYFAVGLIVAFLILVLFLFLRKRKHRRDRRGFDHNKVHKNGTRFDDFGYDFWGYDCNGFDSQGYNKFGRNQKGQYDRFHDTTSCEAEGFCDPYRHQITLTIHAQERMQERLGIGDYEKMYDQALNAYRYGKSKRQVKKTSAYLVDEIEQRHEKSTALIYKSYIYIFSTDNSLITVYKNDKIPL
jgi:hypothetical protein